MPDLELSNDMTLGQVVDAVADNYFSQGVDALTAQAMALHDIYFAYIGVLKSITNDI